MSQPAPEPEPVAPSGEDPAFSVRHLTLDDPWERYSMGATYEDPLVFTGPLSIVGDDPCHARVRRVGHTTFECRIEEWAYLNDRHYEEETGMFALDPGVYTLADGTRVEVGQLRVGTKSEVVRFSKRFDRRPVVLTQVQSEIDSTPVVTRVRGPWTDGFEVRLQMEESKTGRHHDEEIVGWVAIEKGTGTWGGRKFEAGVEYGVRSKWHHISFDRSYRNPVFVGGVQSSNDTEPCGLRYRNLTSTGVDVFVEEEKSDDADLTHGEENIGYVVFES